MSDERFDLSGIDPTRDEASFDRVVDGIMAVASDELERRRTTARPLAAVSAWTRPALAAAAVVAAISVAGLAAVPRPPTSAEPEAGIAEALGVPADLGPFVRGEASPSVANVLVGMAGRR
ncbi:MAG: hypothetical protein R3199_06625 [Gemmatimonadota bacterium]|nr:hypothetical protein [Gemmatimonadota bacterium]